MPQRASPVFSVSDQPDNNTSIKLSTTITFLLYYTLINVVVNHSIKESQGMFMKTTVSITNIGIS